MKKNGLRIRRMTSTTFFLAEINFIVVPKNKFTQKFIQKLKVCKNFTRDKLSVNFFARVDFDFLKNCKKTCKNTQM